MAKTVECEICNFLKNPSNSIIKTKYWQVMLTPDQSNLGRSAVALLEHKPSLSELSREEWEDFEKLVPRLESAYEKAFEGGQPFNWACMMNNAFKENDPNPHVHWHLRPRYDHNISVLGEEFTDPDYGAHYDRNRRQSVSVEVMNEIASRITQHLN